MEETQLPTNNQTAASVREVYSLVQNSMGRIEDKIDSKFDKLDLKIDQLSESLSLKHENLETKMYAHIEKLTGEASITHTKFSNRLGKLENWQTGFKAVGAFLSIIAAFGIPVLLHYYK